MWHLCQEDERLSANVAGLLQSKAGSRTHIERSLTVYVNDDDW